MKILLAAAAFIVLVQFTYSDQLAWITKEQAEKTVEYFKEKEIKQVLLWCACCDNDEKMMVNVSEVYYRVTSDPNYYEVLIKGFFYNGGQFNEPVDLAYVHIQKGKKWKCLGTLLKFECDPCTKPFVF